MCQLDVQWFGLTKDTLRDVLQITPVNNNQAFTSLPSSDALIDFVNELGYPKLVENLSNVITNDMFQPWRAFTTIINLCLTGKISRISEEFTQSIHTFIKDKKNLAQRTHGKKKATLIVIPNSPASKPTKTAKKPKPTAPKADPRPHVSKSALTKQPEPKSAPAKTRGKKQADVQRALEESLKSMYDVPRGSLPSVFISEPEFEKYQPIPEAGSNPDEQDEGQAGPDLGNGKASQPMPSPVVHAGSDREHVDLNVADVSTQPPPDQIDEGFTATAYLKVQKNLKLTVKEQVLLEELASSSGILSSLQHLTKDLSFGDLFFSDKPSEANNDKATAKTEAESMVSVMIQQDMSLILPMTTSIIDITSRPESPKVKERSRKGQNRIKTGQKREALKKDQEKDKIESKPDKNEKRGEAGKC
nr:hypothetical protein [Tanacetum cinerariifolium]